MSFITSKAFGQSGNLASQLQQFASLYSIAKKNNKQLIFPESSNIVNLKASPPMYGLKFANLIDVDIIIKPDEFFHSFVDLELEHTLVDNRVFELNDSTNYNIIGLFHSYEYWYSSIAQEVNMWAWRKDCNADAILKYKSLIQPNKELVSIHVRRGDYLLPHCQETFCILDVNYYSEALQPFVADLERYHFVVFSNDINWCKENLISGEMVTFVDQGSDYVDLIVMSMCDHNIIANSSYSWWAAYKNKNTNKKVICPRNYIKSSSPFSIINEKYYPPTWISIDNIA